MQHRKIHESKPSGGAKKLEGKYANYLKVGHNAVEFILDFGQYYPGSEEAELYTRIITNPAYAKDFFNTLKKSIKQYEKKFEPISDEKA